jgi:hypothetical protein
MAVDPAQVQAPSSALSPKRKRSASPRRNGGDHSSYKHVNTTYDGEHHDNDEDDEDDDNKRQKFLERNRVAGRIITMW